MDEHPLHAQRIGHAAGVLRPGAAKTLQGVALYVIAARQRNAFDRPGHGLHRNGEIALGYILRGLWLAGVAGDARGQFGKALAHPVGVQRGVGLRPEHGRKVLGANAAEHHIRIGDGQRPTAPVAGRARAGPGRIGPHAQPCAIEMQNGTAPGRHGMNVQHRRAHPHPGHLGIEHPLELARVMRHIGRGAPHVEADDLGMARLLRGARHAHDAACRARQNRILPMKGVGLGEPAAGLHEQQLHPRHLGGHLIDIAPQNGREIGVDHRGVAPRDKLHQRAGFMRGAHLRKADFASNARRSKLMRGLAPAVHEHNRRRTQPGIEGILQIAPQGLGIERLQYRAICAYALLRLDHLAVKQLGQHDAAVK